VTTVSQKSMNSNKFYNHDFIYKQNITTLWNLRPPRSDRDTSIVINRCDLCDEHLIDAPDDIETTIDVLDEIDNSYESEYDKHEPRLLLMQLLSERISDSYVVKLDFLEAIFTINSPSRVGLNTFNILVPERS
jgi:hypothetical protein